ncbi:MAG: hypothetical protein IPG35_14935 [Flavobacteriales bacterium]|nr:hypothetical protein [Flavobacteriales bacterium]
MNALVHRDYERSTGSVAIEIHSDRLVFVNPADLPENWTEVDAQQGHISRLVNPSIANVFLFRGYMEQMGSGIPAIIRACKEAKAKAPTWRMKDGILQLTMYLSKTWEQPKTSPREKVILDRMVLGRHYSIGELARVAEVTERQLRRDLQELMTQGRIQRVGKDLRPFTCATKSDEWGRLILPPPAIRTRTGQVGTWPKCVTPRIRTRATAPLTFHSMPRN